MLRDDKGVVGVKDGAQFLGVLTPRDPPAAARLVALIAPSTSVADVHQRLGDLVDVRPEGPSRGQQLRCGVRELGVSEERRVGQQPPVPGQPATAQLRRDG